MKTLSVVSLFLCLTCQAVQAELRLPAVFSDHMVLQRERPVRVWGWADAGAAVSVAFAGQTVQTEADDDGAWRVALEPLEASAESRELVIESGGERVAFGDVLVGEVWLCSGQSNMQWPIKTSWATLPGADEIVADADRPMIRLLDVPRSVRPEPIEDTEAMSWVHCTPETAGPFSAVAYFFGRDLQEALGVPVGLIHSSWGGTSIEAWMSEQAIESDPATATVLEHWGPALAQLRKALSEFEDRKAAGTLPPDRYLTDPGDAEAEAAQYAAADFDDASWSDATLPGYFETDQELYDGIIWYRKQVSLPVSMRGKALALELGPIDDMDHTYLNGELVGRCEVYNEDRHYPVPAALTDADTLTLAVRVFDNFGTGGVWGKPQQMRLIDPDQPDLAVPLAGTWRMHVEHKLEAATGGALVPVGVPGLRPPHIPTVLYNTMIHPLTPLTLRGAIWYQGESNAGRGKQYEALLTQLIADWRDRFDNDELYFGIVQLAGFMPVADEPTDPDWARLRDAQLKVYRDVQRTGLAVTIDIGDPDDIHPGNKWDVGKRLAHWALHDAYGRDLPPSGPLYNNEDVVIVGSNVRITFDFVGDGLKTTDGQPPSDFIIAGDDKVWHWADAKIVGKDTVEVWSDQVSSPVAVRYLWSNSPRNANMTASNGMPAVPFRTDDWPHPSDANRH